MSPRVWLVTGSSSGFGRHIVELLLTKGELVVATARKPEVLDYLKAKYPASQLSTVKLDVEKVQDIKDAFAKAKDAFGRVDVVFNNAGYATFAETEAHPEDDARKVFDADFWGSANVSREAVRFLREENKPSGGLLLVTSAVSGIQSAPVLAYYSAAKHAVEGITQALSLELDPSWNIKISLIEPGAFYTEGVQRAAEGKVPQFSHPAYTEPSLASTRFRAFLGSGVRIGGDPLKAVQRIYEFSLLSDLPFRFPLGKDAVTTIKAELESIGQDVKKCESWSEGLEFDD